ncbi:catalase [Ilumatobacter sp.]|uniref:catalase n=1 Tax=Ilumatobacter sp. TaxID=1967498 RepID=UPI003B52E7AD
MARSASTSKKKLAKSSARSAGSAPAPAGDAGVGIEERTSVELGDQSVQRGVGGETHQVATDGHPRLTTQQGVAVSDDQNWLTAGPRGPQLLEDHVAREKMFHFDHERIPERVVHARGYGAKGVFECYDSLEGTTCASLFGEAGKKTEVFTRFSTVAGNKGSADLARDVRGFAVKFYTDQGNWDLVGNNIPVFFIQDAMKFPDLIHSVKPEPDRGFPQAQSAHDNFWDFASLMPEATHMLMWQMSDRTIPRSFRFMEGFGVHTFRFVTAEGASTYVKFHWKPVAGLQSVVWNEALKINGADPDFHRRDLWNAIDSGDFPEWELGVQMFDDDFADSFDFDVLDSTKLIPEEQVPVTPIGKMTLNRNVDNFFAETEQVAFCTSNVVPGIDFTNDPLLQGRNFSYLDTQLKRLGSPNFTHIPVNAPRCPVMNFQQDGHMATNVPSFGRANYEPNSWGPESNPREAPGAGFTTHPRAEEGQARRVRAESFADHYSQARQFYASQTEIEQTHIADAFVFELSKVDTPAIRQRLVAGLVNVDEDLAATVAAGLGMDVPSALPAAVAPRTDLDPSAALSIVGSTPLASFAGRKLGVLVAQGSDAKTLKAIKAAAKKEKVMVELVAPTRMGITDSDGTELEIAEKIDGGPSVLFDAVAVVLTADCAEMLSRDATSKDFVNDAHAHAKFVAHTASSSALFEAAGITADDMDGGYCELDGKKASASTFVEACRAARFWDREATVDQTP